MVFGGVSVIKLGDQEMEEFIQNIRNSVCKRESFVKEKPLEKILIFLLVHSIFPISIVSS